MWTDSLTPVTELLTALAALIGGVAALGLAMRKLFSRSDSQKAAEPKVSSGMPVPVGGDFRIAWERSEEEISKLHEKVEDLESERRTMVSRIHYLEIILVKNGIDY